MAARLVISPAAPGDAEALAALGRRVFHAAFADGNDPADLAAYLDAAYTPTQQAAEIADPAVTTLLAWLPGEGLVGFAQLRVSAVPACVGDPQSVEIWRLYVDQAWHGRGVAAKLMEACLDDIAGRGGTTAWLGVWERNPRAQAFYRKHGFAPVGTHTFVLGRDHQTDQIWSRSLR